MGNSFYGGQDARPFIITKKFKTVKEMIENFIKGITYTEVNFEDYVLIETINKNHPDNGKIFRRGYNIFDTSKKIECYIEKGHAADGSAYEVALYKNDDKPFGKKKVGEEVEEEIPLISIFWEKTNIEANGAEYIGQIVGPAGGAPIVEFESYEDVEKKLNLTTIEEKYPGSIIKKGTQSVSGESLIPGYKGKENEAYSDENLVNQIEWKWVSIRTPKNESSTVYMGFRIPYTVFHVYASSIESDDKKRTLAIDNKSKKLIHKYGRLIDKESRLEKPFYQRFGIHIPKGVKGDSISNIRLINFTTEGKNIYKWPDEITYEYTEEKDKDGNPKIINTIINNIYSRPENDSNPDREERQIWVCDYTDYELNSKGDKYTVYLEDYNVIQSLEIEEDGTVKFDYTCQNDITEPNKINWIKNVSFEDNGLLTFESNNNNIFNNGTNSLSKQLNWIIKTSFEDNGLFNITFNNANANTGEVNKENQSVINKQLTWIDTLSFEDNGLFEITLNNDTKFKDKDNNGTNSLSKQLNWITGISFNEEGLFNFESNNGKIDYKNEGNRITWITNTSFDDNGLFKITFNNNTIGNTSENNKSIISKQLTWIDALSFTNEGLFNITLNNDIIDTGKKNEEGKSVIDEQLTWIKTIDLQDNGLFNITLNNNTQFKGENSLTKQLTWIKEGSFNDSGDFNITFNNNIIETGKLNENNESIIQEQLTWIKELSFTDEGSFNIILNNNTQFKDEDGNSTNLLSKKIIWIKEGSFNKDNGKFYIGFNNNEIEDIEIMLPLIKEASFIDNTLKIDFVNSSSNNINTTINTEPIKSVDLTDDYKIKLSYTTGNSLESEKSILQNTIIVQNDELDISSQLKNTFWLKGNKTTVMVEDAEVIV